MSNKLFSAFLATWLLGFAACKKDSVPDTSMPAMEMPHNATVRLQWSFLNIDHAYTLDTLLQDGAGHKVKLDTMRFFVSRTLTTNDEGDTVGHFENTAMLLDASVSNDFLLGSIYTSHIHTYRAQLGLVSDVNHALIDTTHAPLNDHSMHWDQPTGYRFLVLTGRVDGNADGVVDASDPAFSYSCGTDALLWHLSILVHHDFAEGETYTGTAYVNMASAFNGIDVLTTPNATGAQPVNLHLVQNFAAAIYGVE